MGTDSIADTFMFYEVPTSIEIRSSSPINITSHSVQNDIKHSISSALQCGQEYIRLDSAHSTTTNVSVSNNANSIPHGAPGRRRLTTVSTLSLTFTVFTDSIDEQLMYQDILDDS